MESNEPPSPDGYFLLLPFLVFAQAISPGLLLEFLLLALLLLASALISGSEVAYFSMTPTDLHQLSNQESRNTRRIIRLKEKPRKLLATILIGNNFVNIAIVILSYYTIQDLFSAQTFLNWGTGIQKIAFLQNVSAEKLGSAIKFLITIVGATFILVLFGEIVPKIYANINNVKLAKITSRPLTFLNILFSPVSMVLVNWSKWMEGKLDTEDQYGRSIKDDLDKAIELTVSHEKNSAKEIDILKSIVKFSEVTAKQIMRSRMDVITLDVTSSFQEVIETVESSGYSRIPIYEEDFDKVVGILYAKDLLIHLGKKNSFKWQNLIRKEVKFIPESKKINELLKEFQQERNHIAIVVDEFGGSAGIVTLEDVMEEVIGDIRDEFDEEIEVDFEQLDKYNYIFEGKTLINDMSRVIGINVNTFDQIRGDADSLAGMMLELLGRIPKKNSEIRYKDFRFKVIAVNERRIEKIQITLPKSLLV